MESEAHWSAGRPRASPSPSACSGTMGTTAGRIGVRYPTPSSTEEGPQPPDKRRPLSLSLGTSLPCPLFPVCGCHHHAQSNGRHGVRPPREDLGVGARRGRCVWDLIAETRAGRSAGHVDIRPPGRYLGEAGREKSRHLPHHSRVSLPVGHRLIIGITRHIHRVSGVSKGPQEADNR
jgi:hypothetical protein